MILLVSAMEREAQGVIRAARLSRALVESPLLFYQGSYEKTPLAMAVTGVGRANTESAMARLCQQVQPRAIVSLGFSGALAADLASGTLVLASRVMAPFTEGEEIYPAPLLMDLSLQLAGELGMKMVVASCLTSLAMASHPRDKEGLGKRYGASAVDMESCWVGRAAASLGVPFMAVRTVLDPLRQRVPALVDRITATGTGNQLALALRYVLARPWEVVALARLARQSYVAEGRLRRFVLPFVSRVWQEIQGPGQA